MDVFFSIIVFCFLGKLEEDNCWWHVTIWQRW